MSLAKIDYALVNAYIGLGLGLSTAYEGQHFRPPTNGADWAAVFILPASNAPATLGVGGEDEEVGILQIDFNRKPAANDTRATLIGYAQAVFDEFVAGKSYERLGQLVTIQSASRSPIREVDGYLRVSVSVNWIARTTRPEI